MIDGNILKTAVIKKLVADFQDYKVYKEAITSPSYPSFFVDLIYQELQKDGYNRYFLYNTFNVKIRLGKDPALISDLNQQLDGAFIDVIASLQKIQTDTLAVVAYNPINTEKNDGVGEVLVDYRIRLKEEEADALMQTLDYKLTIKEV